MDKVQLAKDIVKSIGGKGNVNTFDHCSTRLRFEIKDDKKVNYSELKKQQDIIGVINKENQLQLVIGNNVGVIFKEVQSNLGDINADSSVKSNDLNIIQRAMQTISSIFVPVIPAIAGAGMIRALLSILIATGLINDASNTYYVLRFMADAPFYFLPFLLAYTSARRFKCNPILAMCLAGILIHPNFNSARSAGRSLSVFGLPITMATYSYSVIPTILSVWVMSYIENIAEKVTPSAIKAVFKPLLIIIISGIVGLTLVGPLGTFVGRLLAQGMGFLDGIAPWMLPLVTGAIAPLMVMTGMHYTLVPLTTIQLTNLGYEVVMGPGFLASNMAQSAVSYGVALRTKNKELRQIAISTGTTALMGITEPAMYGVTMKVKKALLAVMIGGTAGGLYAGLSGLVRFSFGTPGLATLPVFIGDDPMNFIHAIITIIITYVVSLAMVFIFKVGDEELIEEPSVDSEKETVELKDIKINIDKPVQGREIEITEINDEVFATQTLGPTKAYYPEKGEIFAPFNGKVVSIFPTKHAIGLQSDEGVEILIHIGIDTVKMDGEGFESFVKEDQLIEKGDKLITFDIDLIKNKNYDPSVIVAVTNSRNFIDVKTKTVEPVAFTII
ncbi:beta-glucoside-specific PTS transporter subunit IIABC [Halanaerobium salsuginis]|jgi:PTS system beta-glucosides-specific IIC component|uniref:PTS system, beta-glucosides-specific IIC component n=1 Tax=Halanaerobium salsuginis TaxID=29563 RepID=A0A1I4K654_9FIRM|nr:beta-glucoside-specific PTS transporter subunit IIABC [Halanaerobium salsuginis]SFL74190.1 PTS system, beta-glucosides-specific IIC component [Halanaerobium salsuginis]